MITTEYAGHRITYSERKELWSCSPLHLSDASLSELKKKIYRYLYKQKTKDLQTIPVLFRDCVVGPWLEGSATSLVERYFSSSRLYCRVSYEMDGKKRSASADTTDVYKIDPEIQNLLQALKTVKQRIANWFDNKSHLYPPKELCKDLGYSQKVAKDSFLLDIDEGD